MRKAALFVGLFAAAAAALSAEAAPVRRAPARPAATRDWSRVVVATPEGGFRMGNPAAKVKLVEYGSLTCPHCRHFNQTGEKPLIDRYVRTGQVSYEFRNLILNGPDIAASLLTRCAGAARFFPMADVVYATQPQWIGRLGAMSEADKAAFEKMDNAQRLTRMAEVAGLTQVAARFGVPPVRARQCLADPAGFKRLGTMAEAANKMGVDHTPTFIVNGQVTAAADWEGLEPLLKQAGG